MRQHALAAVLTAAQRCSSPCSGDDDAASPDHEHDRRPTSLDVARPSPTTRCEANRAAGTITYLTGFDFAAAASIVDVVVADEQRLLRRALPRRGDQRRRSRPPTTRSSPPTMHSSRRRARSASWRRSPNGNDADLVALAVEGQVAIDCLMVKPDVASSLDELAGTTIGVKGKLPPSIAAMLRRRPIWSRATTSRPCCSTASTRSPTWRSTTSSVGPAGRATSPARSSGPVSPSTLYDPPTTTSPARSARSTPTARSSTDHPTAAEDFMRATMRGAGRRRSPTPRPQRRSPSIDQRERQPELPVAGGRDVPLGDRCRADHATRRRRARTSACPPAPSSRPRSRPTTRSASSATTGAPAVDGRFDPDLAAGLYADDDRSSGPPETSGPSGGRRQFAPSS